MRNVIDYQMKIGETAISEIEFDLRSRDEIPKLLRGLQAIYLDREARDQVFAALKEIIPSGVDPKNGRRGMNLWTILVLGALRLNCNWDYDKLLEIANNHNKIRQMLGHGAMDFDYQYRLQTLRDNIRLFTLETLDKINQIAVMKGHRIAGKRKGGKLLGSCDSYVVETNVHFPTDINLLFDAIRVIVREMMKIAGEAGFPGWRNGGSLVRKAKRLLRKAQNLKASKAKDKEKRTKREDEIIDVHLQYIDLARTHVDKAAKAIAVIESADIETALGIQRVEMFIADAARQMDQIRRRVIQGESIPHHEKVFSLFQRHTEWISKGKAGVPVELGLKVCVMKDQHGFILHHRVMRNETDDKVAVSMVEETLKRFPNLSSCSFDKGFHSQDNQKRLSELLDRCYMPRKGRLSAMNSEIENSEEFRRALRKHSAVESSISALESHGLDRCPDNGIHGFKRYVALAVVARNLQIVGNMLQEKEKRKMRRLREAAEARAA